jgi:hypothetical protein
VSRKAAIASLALLCGCAPDRITLIADDGGAADGGDAAAPDLANNAIACTNPGPPIRFAAGDDMCAGAVAARQSRYALCTCLPLVLGGNLSSDSGTMMMQVHSAAIGSDGEVQVGGSANVGGALTAAGAKGINIFRNSTTGRAVRSGGPVSAPSSLFVSGDLYTAGDALGRINVGGTLHLPESANIGASVTAARVMREPVTVDPPCNCTAGPVIDITALIAAHAMRNDNAHFGADPASLAKLGGPTTLDISCGEYYIPSISTPAGADLTLRVHGQAAIYVAGSVALGRGLSVQIDPQAQLDLLVAGDFKAQDGSVGSLFNPSRVRIWVAGSSVQLQGFSSLYGFLYAPSAVLSAGFSLSMTGAAVVQGVSAQDVHAHHDRGLLAGGTACGQPQVPEIQ